MRYYLSFFLTLSVLTISSKLFAATYVTIGGETSNIYFGSSSDLHPYSGINLGPGADLSGAVLNQAWLDSADLTGADLFSDSLSGTNLSSAVLTNANLSDADLTNADLTNASLSNASLRNADFTNANLSNAYVVNATYLESAILDDTELAGVKSGIYNKVVDVLLDNLRDRIRELENNVAMPGPQGPKGDKGDPGPQGPPGLDSSAIQTLKVSEPHVVANEDGTFNVQYTVQSSDDLSTWTDEEIIDATITPESTDKQFLRIGVD